MNAGRDDSPAFTIHRRHPQLGGYADESTRISWNSRSVVGGSAALAEPQQTAAPSRKGRLKQGVTRGVFGRGVLSRTAAVRRRAWAFKDSISSRRPTGRS